MLALFFLGGDVIHGFAFTLLVGVHRRHLLLDLRREPDRAVSRLQASAGEPRRPRRRKPQMQADQRAPMKRPAQRWTLEEPDAALVSALERALGRASTARRGCWSTGDACDPDVATRVMDASLVQRPPLADAVCRTWAAAAERLVRAVRQAGARSRSTATTTSTAFRRAPSCCCSCASSAPSRCCTFRIASGKATACMSARCARFANVGRGWS